MFSRRCQGKRRIPSLKIQRLEARASDRRLNRDRVKIAWKFDRKPARRKLGYNGKSFKRSKTYCPRKCGGASPVSSKSLPSHNDMYHPS
jgi:hypothetical protein